MNKQDIDYLGDGLYAGHDGYQVWLTIGTRENEELIALEESVLKALIKYAKRVGVLNDTIRA